MIDINDSMLIMVRSCSQKKLWLEH